MSRSSSPPDPPAATCSICSKPIRSGGFLQTEAGEVVHIRCRSGRLRLGAIEQKDRAQRAVTRTRELVDDARLRTGAQPAGITRRGDRCPVCRGLATLTDWRPHIDWTTVEGCPCDGFFLWTPLLDEGRLARLTAEDRDTLSQRLRHLRATESEAWLTTRDGTVMGALIIRTERPDRPR